jgi:hypothetical protein
MDDDLEHKYLKYKQKYLSLRQKFDTKQLKKQHGGGLIIYCVKLKILSENSYSAKRMCSSNGIAIKVQNLTWENVIKYLIKTNEIKIKRIIVTDMNNTKHNIKNLKEHVFFNKIKSLSIEIFKK